mgnify:CR=1 FL=1
MGGRSMKLKGDRESDRRRKKKPVKKGWNSR